MNIPSKFCIAPFKNLVVDTDGSMKPCCEYMTKGTAKVEHIVEWWNSDMNELRDNMLSGTVMEGCNHCIAKENNTEYTSHRQMLNKKYEKHIDQSIDDFKQGKELVPQSIELRVSNYCNLKCIMCGEYASSSINQEYQTHKEQYNKIGLFMDNQKTVKWWDDERTISKLQPILENARSVSLAGGEPLLVERLFQLLEQTKFKNDWLLTFTTSLYTKNTKFLNIIAKFKKVDIFVSIEGTGQHNDYVRHGSHWNVIEENVRQLKKTSTRIFINHVLQHTSIFALPALIEFGTNNDIELKLHEVAYQSYPAPGVLTINSAHPSDIAKFKEWLDNYSGPYKKLLEAWVEQYQFEPALNAHFHQYVSMLDRIRNTNFKETFNPTYD